MRETIVPRQMCYRCWRPSSCCLCPAEPPMPTRTRIVLLMHPKEYRHQKCTTGRLLCLNLANSEIIPGIRFEGASRVRELTEDRGNYPVLLYPGEGATDSRDPALREAIPAGRRLVVFIVDGTWHCSRTVVRMNPFLQRLPRLSIHPLAPSRFTIKRQPAPWCLSTIEAAHELLLALEANGLEEYPEKGRLLEAFHRMQDFQVQQIAAAATRPGHRVRGVRGNRTAAT